MTADDLLSLLHESRELLVALPQSTHDRKAILDARDLARRGGPDLAAAMAQNPVPSALVHALLRRPSRAALLELVAMLAAPSSANAQRQAAAHVLQQKLELRECPIEAENPRPISSSAAAALRQRVLALPE